LSRRKFKPSLNGYRKIKDMKKGRVGAPLECFIAVFYLVRRVIIIALSAPKPLSKETARSCPHIKISLTNFPRL